MSLYYGLNRCTYDFLCRERVCQDQGSLIGGKGSLLVIGVIFKLQDASPHVTLNRAGTFESPKHVLVQVGKVILEI